MKNNSLSVGIVIIVVAAASFFGGIKYQQSKVVATRMFGAPQARNTFGGVPNGTARNSSPTGQAGQMGRGGFRPVMGEITEASDKSITVKTADGGSKIVFVSTKTQINKAAVATVSELYKGQTVSIFGQENADGSVTAQSIQLNPLNRNASPSAAPKL